MKYIRDGKGQIKGQIQENGNVVYILDEHGHLKGQYTKSGDKTFDAHGHYIGNGDQLLRLLDK